MVRSPAHFPPSLASKDVGLLSKPCGWGPQRLVGLELVDATATACDAAAQRRQHSMETGPGEDAVSHGAGRAGRSLKWWGLSLRRST